MSTNYNFLYVSQVTLSLFYFNDHLLEKPGHLSRRTPSILLVGLHVPHPWHFRKMGQLALGIP